MKFISKFSNYRVVLRPGIPGNRATGQQAVPGLYVKFEGGIAEVKDEVTIKLMMDHPAFGTDDIAGFIASPEDNKDPYEDRRKSIEPEHNVTNIEYGHVGKSINQKVPVKMSPEQKKALTEIAKKMAVEMATEIIKTELPKMVSAELAKKSETITEPVIEKVDDIPVDVPTEPIEPIVKDIPVSEPINEKLTAPEPVEDTSVQGLNIIKEEAKIGGVESPIVDEVVVTPATEDPIATDNKKVAAPKKVAKKAVVKK